jgi:large subunit ribosomal protein L4
MKQLSFYDFNTKSAGSMEVSINNLPETPHIALIHQAVIVTRNNSRAGTACAKTRAEVNFSTRKPWRQKGTGRARAGMKGSPIWVKGGVAFPPKPRDYSVGFPKKQRRLAFRSAFLLATEKHEGLIVLKNFILPELKTKTILSMLDQNDWLQRRTLFIYDQSNGPIYHALRNVQRVTPMHWHDVCTLHFVQHTRVLITEEALNRLKERIENA